MALGGAYRLGELLKSSYGRHATKGWDHFYCGSCPLETPCKHFDLVIALGLVWLKWLKNGVGKDFIFHAIIPVLYPQNA